MTGRGIAPIDSITRELSGELRNAIFDYYVPQATAILLPEPYYPGGKPATARELRPDQDAIRKQMHFTCNLLLSNTVSRDDHLGEFQKHVYNLNIAGLHVTVVNFNFHPLIDLFVERLTHVGFARRANFPITITLAINEHFVGWHRTGAYDTDLAQWIQYAEWFLNGNGSFDISYTEFLPPTGLRKYEEYFLAGYISSMVQNTFKGRQIRHLQRITDLVREWYQNRPDDEPGIDVEDVEMEELGEDADEDGDSLEWQNRLHFGDGESDESMSSESEDEDNDEEGGRPELFENIDFGEDEDYDEEDDPAFRKRPGDKVPTFEEADDVEEEDEPEDDQDGFRLDEGALTAIARGYDPALFAPDYNPGSNELRFYTVIGGRLVRTG